MDNLGGLGGPGSPGNTSKRWGAKPPTFLGAFPGPRGRPDLKNAPKQIRPDCLQVPSWGLLQPTATQPTGRIKHWVQKYAPIFVLAGRFQNCGSESAEPFLDPL